MHVLYSTSISQIELSKACVLDTLMHIMQKLISLGGKFYPVLSLLTLRICFFNEKNAVGLSGLRKL